MSKLSRDAAALLCKFASCKSMSIPEIETFIEEPLRSSQRFNALLSHGYVEADLETYPPDPFLKGFGVIEPNGYRITEPGQAYVDAVLDDETRFKKTDRKATIAIIVSFLAILLEFSGISILQILQWLS